MGLPRPPHRQVKRVLWDSHDLLIELFDYYAAAGGGMGAIGLNQWSEFVEDFHLDESTSKFCRKSDMDTLFIAVNAASKLIARQTPPRVIA